MFLLKVKKKKKSNVKCMKTIIFKDLGATNPIIIADLLYDPTIFAHKIFIFIYKRAFYIAMEIGMIWY